MEDPLRPKTVPLAAETILWFEFLLDPSLLTTHLKKGSPDPTPIDLINQFIAMSPDNQVIQQVDLTSSDPSVSTLSIPPTPTTPILEPMPVAYRKRLALKVLELKVATYIKWNLDIIEKNLPIPKQVILLRDLCTLSFGRPVKIPLPTDFIPTPAPDGSEKATGFALILYHRWVLRTQILRETVMRAAKPMLHSLLPQDPLSILMLEIPTQPSVEYLMKICQSNDNQFFIFTFETFTPLSHNTESSCQNFDMMLKISMNELKAQIYFDLVGYFLYAKQYELARSSVIECRKHLTETKNEYKRLSFTEFQYCHFKEDDLEGLLLACGVSACPIGLLERLNASVLNQYQDILPILKLDNKARSIPLVNRRIIELDIEGAISQGQLKASKEFEMQVSALNVVRSILETGNAFARVDFFEKYRGLDAFSAVLDGLSDILVTCSLTDRNKIKEFLINCILKNDDPKKLIKQCEILNVFSNLEIEDLKRQVTDEELTIPAMAIQADWKCSSKIPRIEIGSLERQLIGCTNANAVRKLLVKLAATNPSKPLWSVNPSWQIPIPLKSLLMSMQRGFLQDFAYVLLGKSREMASKKDFVGAVSMLSVLKSETQRPDLSNNSASSKLGKLITWEILFIQITQCFDEWNRKPLDLQSLAARSKQCLQSLQNGDNVIPRIEIVEQCAIMLLNVNDWNAIMCLDKRIPSLELPLSFAATFLEMEKLKGSKKVCRDAWDVVLSMFSNSSSKRTAGPSGAGSGGGSSAGGGGGAGTGSGAGGNSRDSPGLVITSNLYPFLKKIRDPLVFSLIISLLSKMHNILKDDANFDLNSEYMHMWPTNISNAISYNIRSVSETLYWLLKFALEFYPQNTCWLKLKGDLELAIGNNESAMRCYVNALITGTEYCALQLQRPIIDDYIVRKMIKCSSNLGCYMQAAVLSQFLDEVDYNLAFKNISEKSANFSDAMDAYYNCVWDSTLLEFIVNLHSKKGEHSRKLEAISVMNNLELNSNNNEEVKREAAAIRKARFLRALAKQYLV